MDRIASRYLYYEGILEVQCHATEVINNYNISSRRTNKFQFERSFRFFSPVEIADEVCLTEEQTKELETQFDRQFALSQVTPIFIELEEQNDFINIEALKIWFFRSEKFKPKNDIDSGEIKLVSWEQLESEIFLPIQESKYQVLSRECFKASTPSNEHYAKLRLNSVIKILNPNFKEKFFCDFIDPHDGTKCNNEVPSDKGICSAHLLEPFSNVQCSHIETETGQQCKNFFNGKKGDYCDDHKKRIENFAPIPKNPVTSFDTGFGCFLPALGLFGLLLFSWFVWCMLLDGCEPNEWASDKPKVIKDTVYIEVLKEITDTLTVIETDTISLRDSIVRRISKTLALPNVQFFIDSDILLPSSADDLAKVAEYLNENSEARGVVYGHTDNVGDDQHNLDLSQRRAQSVKRFLVSMGVDDDRIDAVGKGETEPRAANDSPEGRLMNRRVEIVIIAPPKEDTTTVQVNLDSLDVR